MGMAASQARLLCLTARMHDIEYEAQAIQNAKIQLSTQSDEVYAAYNAALEDETLVLQTQNGKIAATFNNLCGVGAPLSSDGRRFTLISSDNKVIIPDGVAEQYENFWESGIKPKDAKTFAMYALGVDPNLQEVELAEAEEDAYKNSNAAKYSDSELSKKYNRALDILKKSANEDDDVIEEITGLNSYNIYGKTPEEIGPEFATAYQEYRDALYQSNAADIYSNLTGEEDFNRGDYEYYVSIFNQIQAKGDYVRISEYKDKLSGKSVENDSEWLESMIKCGYVSVATVGKDDNGKTKLNTTTPSSDATLGFTSTTSIDKTALAKAEAKYEHDMKQIDKKDKQYDLTLSKLETERNALKTEYDSVKKVIEDNIDRTFGIFS